MVLAVRVSAAKEKENLLIERIEEIRHHIRIESAVQEGSQNMLKHLKVLKSVDKKALQEVSTLQCIHTLHIVACSVMIQLEFERSTEKQIGPSTRFYVHNFGQPITRSDLPVIDVTEGIHAVTCTHCLVTNFLLNICCKLVA